MEFAVAIDRWIHAEKLNDHVEVYYVDDVVWHNELSARFKWASLYVQGRIMGFIEDDHITPIPRRDGSRVYKGSFKTLSDDKLFAADPQFFNKLRTEIEAILKMESDETN